jgi:hypothetical protein
MLDMRLFIEGRDWLSHPITLHLIEREDTKDGWPLTVGHAWIGCRDDFRNFSTVIFLANPSGDDEAWTLNGITSAHAKKHRYDLSLNGISYPVYVGDGRNDLWWWADNPDYDPTDVRSGPKISIHPVFDKLRELGCLG